jgi:uncharacterized protein YdhG (YjbR/CyaY superfamily)
MDSKTLNYNTVDEYISMFPKDVQEKLLQMGKAIKEAAPEAEEKISYRMPAYFKNGPLVYFAAFKNHIGFYPTASGTETFKEEFKPYKSGKGSVQFPMDEPLPIELVKRVVRFKVEENLRAKM